MKQKALLLLTSFFILIQFFRIDKDTPPIDAQKDFIHLSQAPTPIKGMLRKACYDCHSYETDYPWYAEVAPVSWWVKNHINEGRSHLNFSEWGSYPSEKQSHKLEECHEEIQEGEMPLISYTFAHAHARLSDEEKRELVDWFKAQKEKP